MRIGCGVHTDQIETYRKELFALPLIEVENYLYPGFADEMQTELPHIRDALAGYEGEILVSGPYIDLNPGSPERLVSEAAHSRFKQASEFALTLGASQLTFLSTYLPFIGLRYYDADWIARSIAFWQSFLDEINPELTIALGNTFEFDPDNLIRVVEGVDRPNFRLAFDVGHFLVYSQIGLSAWLDQIAEYCQTVYVHSNDGKADTHEEPFKGKLQSSDIALIGERLSAHTDYLLKATNKNTIRESATWLEAAFNEVHFSAHG